MDLQKTGISEECLAPHKKIHQLHTFITIFVTCLKKSAHYLLRNKINVQFFCIMHFIKIMEAQGNLYNRQESNHTPIVYTPHNIHK